MGSSKPRFSYLTQYEKQRKEREALVETRDRRQPKNITELHTQDYFLHIEQETDKQYWVNIGGEVFYFFIDRGLHLNLVRAEELS